MLLAVVCLFLVVGFVFHSSNAVEVPLNLFGITFVPTGLGLLLLLFFFAGGLFGFFVSLLPYFGAKKQVLLLNRKVSGYEKEIAKLRTAPLRT
ncbi:lipopolysaccharide assembly protein LapA domain-containing protein [Exilibacterium tricleocarpae]|uniref:lipopolysaccharide assembly protein LapA domain-containing protein n=1 Tax=Exilibacterium tricleocarpae TaxID=2591008 RepID=UPI0015D42D56|nr:lipopolysaccharide assembly protein LapA domain-containing protein [Exilibacterium tricleocarpae]